MYYLYGLNLRNIQGITAKAVAERLPVPRCSVLEVLMPLRRHHPSAPVFTGGATDIAWGIPIFIAHAGLLTPEEWAKPTLGIWSKGWPATLQLSAVAGGGWLAFVIPLCSMSTGSLVASARACHPKGGGRLLEEEISHEFIKTLRVRIVRR